MFLQWKYRLYDFLLNTFRLLGRGDRSTSPEMAAGPSDTAESSSRDHPQGEYENQGPVGGTTTTSKATTVTTAHDHGGNEIKPCRISIKVSFPIQKQKPKKTSMGLGSNQKHPDMYHCEQILLSMKTEEAAIKTTYLAHSRNRIPRLREMERWKGLK